MYPRGNGRWRGTAARWPQSRAGLRATRDLVLPTTITGSYPRPQWFVEELRGRGFKDALGDSRDRKSTRPELQSRFDLVCRLLLEKKKIKIYKNIHLD